MKFAKLIYIVEDDQITAIIAEEVLKRNHVGARIEIYVNGQQAFDQLTAVVRDGEYIPDLILLDLNMPLMDGWDFLQAFTELGIQKQVPIFMLTSSIRPDDQERALQHEAVKGYFSKPLDDATVTRMQLLLPPREVEPTAG